MKLFTRYAASLTSLPFLISALSIPESPAHNQTLTKRGPEVNYLSNCERVDWAPESTGDGGYKGSYANYYADQDKSQHEEQPTAISKEYRDWSRGGEYLIWEGQRYTLEYPASGVKVEFNINANAGSGKVGDWSGYAIRKSDGKYFNCYKDNGRHLYTKLPPVPDGTNLGIYCIAIYFCN